MYISFTEKGESRFDFSFNDERECWFEVQINEIKVRVSVVEIKYGKYAYTSPDVATKLSSGTYNSNTEKLLKTCYHVQQIATHNIQAGRTKDEVLDAVRSFLTSMGWTELL